jgi:hypothetical protein
MTADSMATTSWMSTIGVRVWWFAVSVPFYTVAWAAAGAMGEVVGEAWGGDFLHQLGHAIGSVLLVGLLALAGWLVLRGRVAWAARWAIAGSIGSLVGLALYLPILALAPVALGELTIALSLHLPLITAAISQAWALRGHVHGPKRWAAAWFFAVLFGVAVAWYTGGGLAGAAAPGSLYPVIEKAVAYWWLMIPRSLLGALVYGVWTALSVPLDRLTPKASA